LEFIVAYQKKSFGASVAQHTDVALAKEELSSIGGGGVPISGTGTVVCTFITAAGAMPNGCSGDVDG